MNRVGVILIWTIFQSFFLKVLFDALFVLRSAFPRLSGFHQLHSGKPHALPLPLRFLLCLPRFFRLPCSLCLPSLGVEALLEAKRLQVLHLSPGRCYGLLSFPPLPFRLGREHAHGGWH